MPAPRTTPLPLHRACAHWSPEAHAWPACSHRFCDPTHLPLLHEERRIAASQTDPYYLVLGTFKGTKPEDLGFPDKRWLSLDEMCATLEVATIEQKVEEYEAASKAARLAKLAASLPASPNALPATQDT